MAATKTHWRVAIAHDAFPLGGALTWFLGNGDDNAQMLWPKYPTYHEAVTTCHHYATGKERRAILYRVVPSGRTLKDTCFMRGKVFKWDRKDERWYDVEGPEWAEKVGLDARLAA